LPRIISDRVSIEGWAKIAVAARIRDRKRKSDYKEKGGRTVDGRSGLDRRLNPAAKASTEATDLRKS